MEAAGPALRYGFLGCGMMGQEHLRNLSLLTSSRARVVAIFEPDEQMAAISLALADPGAELVGSVEALVAHPAVDAIVIASPNHRHCEQLQMVVRHLHKAVLVEKPVCTNLEDVHVLRRLTTSASIVWTAMEYRFMPAISTFLRLAHDSTTTGEIVSVSIREHRFPFLDKVGNWNRFNKNTGGTMVEKCCHFFDLMRLIMQDEPMRVFASGGQNCNHLDECIDGETPDIVDNAFVVVDFPRNRRAMLDLCMFAEGSRYQEELSAVGSKGKIEAKVPGPARFWPAHLGDLPVAKVIVSPRHPAGPTEVDVPVDATLLAAGDHNGSTFYQHELFLGAATGQGPVHVSLDDGLRAVVIGLAAECSLKTGQVVDLTDGPYALWPAARAGE